MKRILITGGAGYVGGRLARRLAKENIVYISSRKAIEKDTLQLYGNVEWLEHKRLLTNESFPDVDAVIHLAALNEHDSLKYPSQAINVNVEETRVVLENSISRRVTQFIYFSTAHVYGSPLTGKITENTLPMPMHPYAITHRAAEDYVIAASVQKRIQGNVFRLSNSFGAPVTPSVTRWTLLTNDLCRQAVEKGKMFLHSNGCQYRDFICLTDVEDIIDSILRKRHPLKKIVYNLGTGLSTRIIDQARRIERLSISVLSKNVPIVLPAEAKQTTEPELEFSIGQLLSEGFHIRNDVDFELEQLLNFCLENFSH